MGIPLTVIFPLAACEPAYNNVCGTFAIKTLGTCAVGSHCEQDRHLHVLFIFRNMCGALSSAADRRLEPMPDLNSPEMKCGDMSLASRYFYQSQITLQLHTV